MSSGTKKHTHICTFAFRCNLPPETIWNIAVEAENRDLLVESILRLTLSLWIYLFLDKVQGHSRKVSWRMSIEQMQRCNCHPSPVLLDYTALVHSHAWKHLIVSKLDFGSRFQKKRSSKIWSSNQLLKLWAINVSIIAMHWIILKIITINIHNILISIIIPFKLCRTAQLVTLSVSALCVKGGPWLKRCKKLPKVDLRFSSKKIINSYLLLFLSS